MIVDSSAIVAILRQEEEDLEFRELIGRQRPKLSAVTLLETSMVVGPDRHHKLKEFMSAAEMQVVPFDASQAELAWDAHRRFGRGSDSPARLNFGDCMVYALAKGSGEPLLFKGDDFSHTDITPAR